MPGLHYVRGEIERMRRQILRQLKKIQDLQRAGIPAKDAEELLERMLACARSATSSAKSRGSNNTEAINGPNRAALPVSVYRRILRGAEQARRYWGALEEEKCIGQHFHTLRNFCEERGLSLSRHGPR